MIQPLRSAHQWIMGGLALALPTIFVAGLAVRQPSPPVSASFPGRRVWAGNIPGELRSFHKALVPDLLVYWAQSVPSDATLPPDARLLGSLHGAQDLDAPPFPGGYLLAYSLPDRRVVASVAMSREARRP
jgi:hypothetical protein